MTWQPKRRSKVLAPGIWREYLTPIEQAAVVAAEAMMVEGKAKMAAATAVLAPIRNRAHNRAKYIMGLTPYHKHSVKPCKHIRRVDTRKEPG